MGIFLNTISISNCNTAEGCGQQRFFVFFFSKYFYYNFIRNSYSNRKWQENNQHFFRCFVLFPNKTMKICNPCQCHGNSYQHRSKHKVHEVCERVADLVDVEIAVNRIVLAVNYNGFKVVVGIIMNNPVRV